MSNEASLFATMSAWPWYLSLVAIILGVVLVLGVLFIGLRLALGLWGRYRKQREVRSLHQDLMIWSRLSALVRGGKEADQAKSTLSVKLQEIERALTQGLKHVKQHRHLGKNQPWVLLLGEPHAGKSSLIRNSALDWHYMRKADGTTNGNTDDNTDDNTELPVQFVVGPEAVVIEVKGQIFFDAWANGSGAEFAHLIKLLRANKRQRALPLNEIMLCIPADALLADRAEIAQRKASLIADELLRLTEQLKMYLPVTIMITKLDEVLGLREYAAALGEKMSQQALGMSLGPEEYYEPERLHQFFSDLTARLQEGALELMLSPEVLALNNQGRSRLDKTALIYLFAQNFVALEPQLTLYLNTIFGHSSNAKQHYITLKGVYFSSAQDHGVCFNESFAQLSHQAIDDALYFDPKAVTPESTSEQVGPASQDPSAAPNAGTSAGTSPATGAPAQPPHFAAHAVSKPYFIKDALLRCLAPQVISAAHYNRAGRWRAQLPWLGGAAMCTVLSVIALYGAIWQAPRLSRALQDDVLYYQSLAQLLSHNDIDHAILFDLDAQGQPQTYFEQPMPNMTAWTRLNFFSQAQLRLNMDEDLPWHFAPWVNFFFSGDRTAMPERYFIYDQIQTQMAYLPLVRTVERHLERNLDQPYELSKRNALFALLEIASFHELNADARHNQAYNADIMASFLAYLYPQLGTNLTRKLSYFLPEYDYHAQATNDTIVLDVFYQQLCERSITDFLTQWQDLHNYPESTYQQFKQQLKLLAQAEYLRQELSVLEHTPLSQDQLTAFNQQVRTWRQSLLASVQAIDPHFLPHLVTTLAQQLSAKNQAKSAAPSSAPSSVSSNAPSSVPSNEPSATAAIGLALGQQLKQAYAHYQEQLETDFTQLEPLRAALHQTNRVAQADVNLPELKNQINSALEHDFAQVNDLLKQVFTGPLLNTVGLSQDSAEPNQFEYEVLAQLSQLITIPEHKSEIVDVPSALSALKSLDQAYHQQLQVLTALLKHYEPSYIAQSTQELWPQLLDYQYQEAQIDLYQRLLALYPDSAKAQTQLADLSLAIGRFPMQEVLSEHQLDSDYLNLIGQVNLRSEFNPHGFAALVEPLVYLHLKLQPKENAQGTAHAQAPAPTQVATLAPSGAATSTGAGSPDFSADFLRSNMQLRSLWHALQSYTQAYLNYWARLADSVAFSAQSYYEFHLATQQFKAYELNAQLQKLYELSQESLAQIPPELLSEAAYQRQTQAQALIEQRLDCFSLDFNDQCAGTINTWSLLPASALQATRQVNNLLSSGQGERLFAPESPESASYLPWWDHFTKLGRELLQHNVHEESDLTINALLMRLDAFPLAADGASDTALSRSELKNLYQQFKLLGLEQITAPQEAIPNTAEQALLSLNAAVSPAPTPHIEPLNLNSEKLNALSQIGSLLSALVAEPQLKMQITLLDGATQQELKQRLGLISPLALLRYRYLSLEQHNTLSAPQRLVPTQGTPSTAADAVNADAHAGAALWTTSLDSTDFALHFYRYLGQSEPTVSLSFSDVYPLLKLYTQEDGFFDRTQGCHYIPLYVNDPKLGTSIYFVGLKALSSEQGEALPQPANWPRSETFTYFQ